MTKLKTGILIFFSIWMPALVSAQYADVEQVADSLNYYPAHWKKNVDSLSGEWLTNRVITSGIANKIEASSGIKAQKVLENLFPGSGLIYRDRTMDLLRVYPANGNNSAAIAIYYYYKPLFEEALKKEGLPPVLSCLTFALSAMQNNARSYTGGVGFWQLDYSYGRKFGLQIDSYVDERRDAAKSSAAAAKTLKMLYEIYGDWKLTLAAYTCGPANVNKAIRRNGNRVDFYTIYPSLPYFGRDVVDAFAASLLFLNSNKNLYIIDYKPVADSIEVSKRLHFVQISDILHIDINQLRFLNPAYKFDIIPAINKVYLLLLPAGYLDSFNLYEDSIYAYKDSILFNLHKKVILPPPPKGRHWATPAKAEIPDNSVAVYYHIKSGDNLGYVASWFDVSVSRIEDWNNIYNPRRLQIGKKLKIYVPENKAAYYRKIDNMSFADKQKMVGKTSGNGGAKTTAKPKKEEKPTSGFFWYTVKNGESPYIIAKKFPGVSADDILRWNNIEDPRKIKPGQKLKIKKVK